MYSKQIKLLVRPNEAAGGQLHSLLVLTIWQIADSNVENLTYFFNWYVKLHYVILFKVQLIIKYLKKLFKNSLYFYEG